jgi:hypothetical protein
MPGYTSDGLASVIQGVANNVIDAGIHYKLFRDLLESIPAHERVLEQSRAFWTLTFVAHRDAAVLRLCRVYDQEKRAVGLQVLLKAIQDNSSLFDEEHFRERLNGNPHLDELARRSRLPDPVVLANDVHLTADDNDLVKRLVILRNNIFAHTSPTYSQDPRKFERDFALEAEEIWDLVKRALDIVNRYADLFYAQTYATQIIGHDDYKSVLASLQRDYDAREEEVLRELEEAGDLEIDGNIRRRRAT